MPVNDDTWVVIPLFNEAPVIAGVVEGLRERFPHVLCVDDASVDGGGQAARRAGAWVAAHPVNLGQGAALQTGFDWALQRGARFVVTFDADGQHQARDAEAMVATARERDLAFVLGSRFLGAAPQGMGAARRAVVRAAALATRWRSGLPVTDAHNGLRVIRADALERVRLTHNRMAHASQIVSQLGATGLPWAEAPVTIRYSEYSRSKGQPLLNSVNILVDLALEDA